MLYIIIIVITLFILISLWCMLKIAKMSDERTYKD